MLREVEDKKKQKVASDDALAVGLARAGSSQPTLKAGFVSELLSFDFGAPPMTLIFPGQLHFMEAEALIALANAPEKLRKMTT